MPDQIPSGEQVKFAFTLGLTNDANPGVPDAYKLEKLAPLIAAITVDDGSGVTFGVEILGSGELPSNFNF